MTSFCCLQEKHQAREAILEMRENAVAAKEEQALADEAAHVSSAGNGHTEGAAAQSAGAPGVPLAPEQGAAEPDCNGHAAEEDADDIIVEVDANGHTGKHKLNLTLELPLCVLYN